MPVIMREQVIPAGGVIDNMFSGSAYEFARTDQVASIAVSQSVAGSFATLQSGGDVVAEEFIPPILTRYPIIPDEMYFNDVMAAGDRLVLRVRNPSAGSMTIRAIAQLQPVR